MTGKEDKISKKEKRKKSREIDQLSALSKIK